MIQMTSNINEVTEKMLKEFPEATDKALRETAERMLAQIGTRIYEQGGAQSGDIGKYSTKPIYISASASPRSFGRPIGKTGKSKFKTGQDHKSRYFERGYDEFKTTVGRNIGKVNLSLSGQLNLQTTVIAITGGYGIGWARDEQFNIAEGQEKHFGKKIWSLTSDEDIEARRIAQETFIKHLN